MRTRAESRLSCRIDPLLMAWVRSYAKQCGTSVTRLITNMLVKLRTEQERRGRGTMEQL